MTTPRMAANSAALEFAPTHFPAWRLIDRLPTAYFQDGLTIARFRAEPTGAGASDGMILLEAVTATQAILHAQAFTHWREAALWRRLYAHEAFAEVLDLPTAPDAFAVVQRLPQPARPMLLPAQPDGSRAPDPGLGRALPERTVITMLRKLLEGVEFLQARTRTLGPSPSPAALLDGVWFVPDLSAPRIKLLSGYAGLPAAPDASGRRHLGPLLALFGRLLLTGQYEAAGGGGNMSVAAVKSARPELTTQLPAWIEAMHSFDGGAGGAVKWLEQFDRYIGQVNSDQVSAMYRPLG